MATSNKAGRTWGLLLPSSILNGSEAPRLLGRIVANVDDLLQDYVPENPQDVISSVPDLEPMEVVDNDVETFISATEGEEAQVRLAQIFGVTKGSSQQHSSRFKAQTVITRVLRQHDKVFTALMKTHNKDIIELLKKQSTQRGYLIVGLKTCVDAEICSSAQSSGKGGITLEVPLQEAAIAFGAPPLPINLVNPSITVNRENSRDLLSRFVASGERIFSVRVREIKFHGFLSKQPRVGDAIRFPDQRGTFGDDRQKPAVQDRSSSRSEEDIALSQVSLEEKIERDADAEDVLFVVF